MGRAILWAVAVLMWGGALAQAQNGPRGEGQRAQAPGGGDVVVVGVPVLPSRIEFRNDLGRPYRVTEVRLYLDGRQIMHRVAEDDGEISGVVTAYDGPMMPGDHRIETRAVVQPRNRGIFTYLDNYRIEVSSSDVFVARDEAAAFTVALDERPGATVPFERKPSVAIRREVSAPPSPLPEVRVVAPPTSAE